MTTAESDSSPNWAKFQAAIQESPRPVRRTHTDAQLVRKRQVDRVKQKSNRDENKKRMERLESDVALLLSKVDSISRHLHLHRGPSLSPSHLPLSLSRVTDDSQMALEATCFRTRRPQAGLVGCNVLHPGQPTTTLPLPPPTLATHCRCGVEHQSLTDCLEYSGFAMLYEAHIGIAQDPNRVPPRLPLNPPVVNMMLHSTDGNPVVFFATTILRQFVILDTQSLLGLYLLAYRFLRWRLYPDAASLEGVPDWLRPTDIQEAIVHPLCIDYIPWPALRNFLCQNQNRDRRHSVALYIRSLRLNWPSENPLLLTDLTHGGVILNPDFPGFAMDIRNWELGSPWADEFPQLTKFIKL